MDTLHLCTGIAGLVLKSYATDGFTLTTENKASSQIEAKDPVRMSARSGMMSTSQTKVAAYKLCSRFWHKGFPSTTAKTVEAALVLCNSCNIYQKRSRNII